GERRHVANVSHERNMTARVWAAVSDGEARHPELARGLAGALVETPHAAELHNALGLIEQPRNPALAAGHFGRAVEAGPANVMAGLNLAEALALCGKREAAVAQVQRTLGIVNECKNRDRRLTEASQSPFVMLDAPHFPAGFDFFRVEWERAAWSNAGRPDAEAGDKT